MQSRDTSPGRTAASTRPAAPLKFADRLALPVGQNVPVALPARTALGEAIRDAVVPDGFTVVESTLGATTGSAGHANPDGTGVLIGERNVRRVATSRSMRVSIAVLVAAGAGLGGLDLIVGGSWTYAAPWVVVAAAGAFVLWLRYGRSYESEVISVAVHPGVGPRPSPAIGGSGSPSATVQWNVGRIRSVAFAGSRAAVDVKDCPVPLMEAVARVVRRFQAQENN